MDYSPWSERDNWPFLKVEIIISKIEEAAPTKIGVHAFDINPYLHDFFEPIPNNSIFWRPWTIVHGPKGKFGCVWKWQYLRNQRGHAHQNWCTCIWHQSLLTWIFWADSNWLIFWRPWTNFGQFWKGKPCPLNLVCMHISLTLTSIWFWADFNFIKTNTKTSYILVTKTKTKSNQHFTMIPSSFELFDGICLYCFIIIMKLLYILKVYFCL